MESDEILDAEIRSLLSHVEEHVRAKKMFGGLSFLYKGKMTVGFYKGNMVVRVLAEKMDEILKMDYVEKMKATGRPMKEFVSVQPEAYKTIEQKAFWVELGLEHARKALKEK